MAKKKVLNHTKLDTETILHIENSLLKGLIPHINPPYYLLSVELVRELGDWYARIYVTKQDKRISLDECETITREIDPIIESITEKIDTFNNFHYNLEVSSPGLFKALRTQREFDFYTGNEIHIQDFDISDKKQENPVIDQKGVLISFDAQKNELQLKNKNGDIETHIISKTAKISLYHDLSADFREDKESLSITNEE